MQIKFNGDIMCVTDNLTLTVLVKELQLPDIGIAIAVNKQIKPRSMWDEYYLQENDDVLIIKATCGG